MSTVFGSTTAGALFILLIILVIVLLIIMVNLNLRMNRLQRRYRLFMKGTDGQSVEKAMANRLKEVAKLKIGQEENTRALMLLRHQHDKMLCKYGIVKYDAFEDVGGKMSFALAMLDQSNTGFVLNAIHSRDNCYLYLKDVVNGTSYIMLSDEEVEALRRAAYSGEELIEQEETARKEKKKVKKKAPAAKPEKTREKPADTEAEMMYAEEAEQEAPAASEEDIDPELADLLRRYAQDEKKEEAPDQ